MASGWNTVGQTCLSSLCVHLLRLRGTMSVRPSSVSVNWVKICHFCLYFLIYSSDLEELLLHVQWQHNIVESIYCHWIAVNHLSSLLYMKTKHVWSHKRFTDILEMSSWFILILSDKYYTWQVNCCHLGTMNNSEVITVMGYFLTLTLVDWYQWV